MISITNAVTFIEVSDEADVLTITGGERYHTHTKAVGCILHQADNKIPFIFSFISPKSETSEGKIQFKIKGANNALVPDSDEELQIYQHFAEKLRTLFRDTELYHSLVSNGDDITAKELNQAHHFKLSKIALELSKIERDLILVFNTESAITIEPISVKKLTKLKPLTELIEHEKHKILIDEYAKYNKSGNITVTLKDFSTHDLLGHKITIRENLVDEVYQAYLQGTPVNITVLNKDRVTPNKCMLTGEITKIDITSDLFSTAGFEVGSF